MPPPQPSNSTPIWVFIIILLLVMIGFGGGTFIQVTCPGKECPDCPPVTPAPATGCVNPQPIQTIEQPQYEDYTVIVSEFNPKQEAEARLFSAELRTEKRINNHVYQKKNKNWIVTVGRFLVEEQAKRMQLRLAQKGLQNTEVYRMSSEPDPKPKPPPQPYGCSA